MRKQLAGFRVVSLDTDHSEPDDRDHASLDRLMRGTPTPYKERANVVRTRQGNIVQAVAR